MNRIERRMRSMINPYSTAFAIWWCHFGREWRMPHEWTSGLSSARPIAQRRSQDHSGVAAGSGNNGTAGQTASCSTTDRVAE
jgi:hypothetical protein